MKQAPLRGLRWRPGASVGTKSGMRLWFVMGPAPKPRNADLSQCATDPREAPEMVAGWPAGRTPVAARRRPTYAAGAA